MNISTEEKNDTFSVKITAHENNCIVGWAFLVVIKNDRHEEPYGIMENVYVEQAYRGKGYGRELIEAVIEEAKKRGCYKLLSQSRYEKDRVHDLYMRYGFKDHGKNFRMDLINSKPLQQD